VNLLSVYTVVSLIFGLAAGGLGLRFFLARRPLVIEFSLLLLPSVVAVALLAVSVFPMYGLPVLFTTGTWGIVAALLARRFPGYLILGMFDESLKEVVDGSLIVTGYDWSIQGDRIVIDGAESPILLETNTLVGAGVLIPTARSDFQLVAELAETVRVIYMSRLDTANRPAAVFYLVAGMLSMIFGLSRLI
jgi:hypothetical protein